MTNYAHDRRGFLKVVAFGAVAVFLPQATFAGEKEQEEPFTFVQLCDTQLGFGGYDHDVRSFRQAVKQCNALKPDFVVICGDLVDGPTKKSITDFNNIKAGFTMPCYCAPGNHDLGSVDEYRKNIGKD